jgi:Protein of unknown function (DUF2442)
MVHEIYQVTSLKKVEPFTLEVFFNDATSQIINFVPVLRGDLYGPLRNPSVFDQVSIDPEVRTLIWPNGADFDPAILHDWPKSDAELKKLAESWQSKVESSSADS